MRYHVAHIETHFAEQWQLDVFEQSLFDLGFDTIDGQDAYIPSDSWKANQAEIKTLCAATEGVTLLGVEACPDENWNAVWESEHPLQNLPLDIQIVPHCAFGAGHHETTSMMVEELINLQFPISNFKFNRVLDHGTGTGILAIYAKKLGAEHVVAVDIDEKSVANAKENAARNNVEIEVMELSEFSFQHSAFNLILANIHRNILLEYMPQYAASLTVNGELWLSGFYEEDCASLIDAAQANGLRLLGKKENNQWYMLKFINDGKR
ncbi:MAG: 50S ribosomal protein L11 methyltransferase [Paludibacteraceae bacterium]|nr:50S ribosomal protein L11 methyltransferase [Paludibacteraceae bacterium]